MPVNLDHLIVRSRDKRASAAFLAEMLGLPPPSTVGPGARFHAIRLAGGTSLDFADAGEQFTPQPPHIRTRSKGRRNTSDSKLLHLKRFVFTGRTMPALTVGQLVRSSDGSG